MCVYMRVTYALTIVSTCIICIGEDPYELLWGEQRRIKPPAAPEEQSAPENRRDYGMENNLVREGKSVSITTSRSDIQSYAWVCGQAVASAK